MIDFDALLEQAAPAETTVPICLDGPLRRRYEDLKDRIDARAMVAGTDGGDTRLGSRRKADPEQADLDAVIAQIQERTIPFVLKAKTRDEFVELISSPEHTARKNKQTGEVDPRDRGLGVNIDSLVPALIRACIAEPDVTSDERWKKLWARLSSAQADKLFAAAWDLNREDREVPFSPSGSESPPS